MNKTVSINLAGVFFHIDEDAYLKLQRYLKAIKNSFKNTQGESEIISDIEARIAELFNERKQNKQVISNNDVEDVISIMGQPEDYIVDDEIFDDEPEPIYNRRHTPSKKLFRDGDNSYVAGVSSGISHYFGIDPIWIRLAWIILFLSAGTGVLLYIILWVLIPEAKTTAEKIMMTGEPVNISNIEKKIKDGFETVTDVAKNVTDSITDVAKKIDFQKQGNRVKSGSKNFFDTLADIIMFFFKIFAKFIGIILVLIGAISLIALIIGLFSLNIVNFIHIPGLDLVNIVNSGNTPIWLVSILVFFAVGIIFFFIFYLGLKILINNLKSIGNIAKLTLLGVWLISFIGLVVISIRTANEHAFNEHFAIKKELNITAKDTLKIKIAENELFSENYKIRNAFKIKTNEKGEKIIYSSDIYILVKSTTDSLATIKIEKSADGRDYENAITRAKNIIYNYNLKNNELILEPYFSTASKNKYNNQEVLITLYLPEETIINFNKNTKSFLHHHMDSKHRNHYLKITEDAIKCTDCKDDNENINVNIKTPSIKIDDNGIEINSNNNHLKIDENGIKAKSNEIKIDINENNVNIESNE